MSKFWGKSKKKKIKRSNLEIKSNNFKKEVKVLRWSQKYYIQVGILEIKSQKMS